MVAIFGGKNYVRKRAKNTNDNCFVVFEFDAILRRLFGFCKKGGLGGGGRTPR